MTTPKNVQLCLVLDCTASMGDWIHAAKMRLISSLETIKQSFPTDTIHVGFVGYRDVNDRERFIMHPFTTDHESVVKTIKRVSADGGDDVAEDVGGAYQKVLTMGWSADVRVLFHICDAPNHGREYHSPYVDDAYLDGTGESDLKEHVKRLAEQRVDINFLRLNNMTDVMTTLMQTEYEKIRPTGFMVMNIPNQLSPVGTDDEDEIGSPVPRLGFRSDESEYPPVSLGRHSSSMIFEDMLIRVTSSAMASNPEPPSQA